MTENTDQKNTITLGLITSWGLGILLLLSGLAAFSNPKTTGSGVPLLLIALLLLPPIRRFVYKKTGKSLSTGVRVVFVLVLMGIAFTPPASPVTPNSPSNPPAHSQQPLYDAQQHQQAEALVRLAKAQPENLDTDLAMIFGFGGGSTDLQRDNTQERVKGKVVQWSLLVFNIRRSEGDTYRVETKIKTEGVNIVDTSVTITPRDERDRQLLAALKIGDTFTFKGVIKSIWAAPALRTLAIEPAILQ